jgi:hypothetical protein
MADKAEYKKIQDDILRLLFDKAHAVTFTDICAFTKKPTSETEYHIDVLLGERLIGSHSVGASHLRGYEITSAGRKRIMEA